jgi:hypothetical protein
MSPSNVVRTFLSNYSLLAQGGDTFRQAQTQLLAPDVKVQVNNFGTPMSYSGPDGYFSSLGDWGRLFATGPDFKVDAPAAPSSDGRWQAHLGGTLTLTRDGHSLTIAPNEHHWTETFRIEAGHITRLSVDMSISPAALK